MDKGLGWNGEKINCLCRGVVRGHSTEEVGFLLRLKAEQFCGTVVWGENHMCKGHTNEMCKNRRRFGKVE